MTTTRIKVGYDGTTASLEAVRWAADEAAARGATLTIISCYGMPYVGDPLGGVVTAQALDTVRAAAADMVEAAELAIRAEHPDLAVTSGVCMGPAATPLVEEMGAGDLVVVGKSHHEGASAFWLGSTPRAVLHHSQSPVVVVHGGASRGRPDRIVIGIDDTASADQALAWAADEADRHHVPLLVVHAWSYVNIVIGQTSAQMRDVAAVDAACTLEEAVEFARHRCGVEVTSQLMEQDPVTALVDTVRDGDLLVLGTHGRRGIVSAVLGSTVNSVLEHVAVPVVVVR